MVEARERAINDHRRKVFGAAMDAWGTAAAIREFCDALAASAAPESEQASAVERWVEWARAWADQIDPTLGFHGPLAAGFDSDPGPDELRPYLGEWSPHGPEHKDRPTERPASEPSPVSYDDLYPSAWRWGRPGRAQWWRR